jgi:hypothetical protein
MKTYNIEARVTRSEFLTVTANGIKEAIKIAEETDGPEWEQGDEDPRHLVSIS